MAPPNIFLYQQFHVLSLNIHSLCLDVDVWIVLIIGADTKVKFSSLKTKSMLTSTEKQELSLKGITASSRCYRNKKNADIRTFTQSGL